MNLIKEKEIGLYDNISVEMTVKDFLVIHSLLGKASRDSARAAVKNIAFIKQKVVQDFIKEYDDEDAENLYDDCIKIASQLEIGLE